jgi:menaquinone-dependent protoporphyrinogen oxidase
MRVLVAYASAHASTAQVARRVAEVLEREGLAVELLPVRQVQGLEGYGGVVLGSAIHNQTWMLEAGGFVRHHAGALVMRPVWLFSVGMSAGLPRWVRGAARSGQNRRLAKALRDVVRPRGHLLLPAADRRTEPRKEAWMSIHPMSGWRPAEPPHTPEGKHHEQSGQPLDPSSGASDTAGPHEARALGPAGARHRGRRARGGPDRRRGAGGGGGGGGGPAAGGV